MERIRSNGRRPESNNFLIDGANNFNGWDGGFVLKPPVDAISEVSHHHAWRQCRVRRRTRVNDEHHHSVRHSSMSTVRCEFLRNDAVDANNWLAQTKRPLKQNQFGATVGAPIKRKRRSFSTWKASAIARASALTTVPSLKQRTGDFSELCPGHHEIASATTPARSFSTSSPMHRTRVTLCRQIRINSFLACC